MAAVCAMFLEACTSVTGMANGDILVHAKQKPGSAFAGMAAAEMWQLLTSLEDSSKSVKCDFHWAKP